MCNEIFTLFCNHKLADDLLALDVLKSTKILTLSREVSQDIIININPNLNEQQ